MATFVLVHGGWHGGWCWRRVAPLLRAAGHEVWTPTLTGLGERVHLLSARIDLDTHIRDVLGVLEWEDVRQATLVGHSYAGMVITGVADQAVDRLARLVYLDAFVPTDDQSLHDLLRPERRDHYRQQARMHGDGWLVPPPSAQAMGISDEEQASWLNAKLTPQPLRTLERAVRLGNPAAAALPRTYIHCTEGPVVSSFAPFADRFRGDPAWCYQELATGHDAMLTAPEALTDLLLRSIERA